LTLTGLSSIKKAPRVYVSPAFISRVFENPSDVI
jgi:hypothetical protein